MNNSRVIRRPVATRSATKEKANGKGKWIAAVLLLLLMAGIAYAFYPSRDPALARIDEIRAQMDGASDAQRRELWGEMRKQFENLSPEARDQMREDWGRRRETHEAQGLSEFFALSPQEQIKKLDEDIKRDAQRRRQWAQRSGNGGGRGPGGGRGFRGGNNSGDPNARRKSYLDNTSAMSRAMRSEYRRMRDERSKQLGL